MILQWHPEMGMIVDADRHRRREQDERKQEAREFLADAALISRLADPHRVTWPGGGHWPSGCEKHQMLAPDCRDCATAYVLRKDAPALDESPVPGTSGPFAIVGYDLPGREPAPPPDPAGEVQAALAEYDRWRESDALGALAASIPDILPGTCRNCRAGKAVPHMPGGQCWYCAQAAELRNASQVPAPARDVRQQNRRTAACMLAIMTAFTLLILSVKLAVPWLELASVAPFIAGVRGMRR